MSGPACPWQAGLSVTLLRSRWLLRSICPRGSVVILQRALRTVESCTVEPNAEEPCAAESDATEPGAAEPGAAELGAAEPCAALFGCITPVFVTLPNHNRPEAVRVNLVCLGFDFAMVKSDVIESSRYGGAPAEGNEHRWQTVGDDFLTDGLRLRSGWR